MSQTALFLNKTVVVTGAGHGIGLCIADTFLQAGGQVVIAEAEAALREPALKRLDAPGRVEWLCADIGTEAAASEAVGLAVTRFGRLDAVIHNAAVADNRPVETLTYEAWRRVIDTNLSAAFLLAKYAAPHLRKACGAMVLIASTRALMSEPDTEAYAASKAGLAGLAHALAVSLAPVRVNCVCPGWIVTDRWRHDGRTTPLTEQDHTQHPAGRVGYPEDIAEMALYLCSEKAGFITGQNVVIDGGMTKKMIYC